MKKSDLTIEDARRIRRLSKEGVPLRAIARDLGVHVSSIADIVHERTHAPRLTVALDDITIEAIEEIAEERGVSVNDLAALALRQLAKTG